MSPNFDFRRNVTTHNVTTWMNNSLPLIYINENNFTKNMAYFSSNALSIINTMKFTEDFVDYMQFCGAGIEISGNTFMSNIGLKKNNGGAKDKMTSKKPVPRTPIGKGKGGKGKCKKGPR